MPKFWIVGDKENVREFANSFFPKRSIDVTTAAGGREALEIIGRERPDLVLLDVRMEEMTGVEVLKELRDKQDDTKVIMVSGVNDEEVVNEAKSYGVRGFVHKPLVLEELEKIVLAELKK